MNRPGKPIVVVLWAWPPDSKHAGNRFWAAHSVESDGRLADWPMAPLNLIPLGAAKVDVVEGKGLELIETAAASRPI